MEMSPASRDWKLLLRNGIFLVFLICLIVKNVEASMSKSEHALIV
jgi:hypothetical protein